MKRSFLFRATFLLSILTLPANVFGDDNSEKATAAARAESLIRQAVELRRAGKDALAYPLVQQAYDIQPTPRTAAQLGLVEMELGYWLLSERHLSEALASPRDLWVHGNRASLEDALRKVKSGIGRSSFRGPRGCAEIYSDLTGARRNAVVGYVAGGPFGGGLGSTLSSRAETR